MATNMAELILTTRHRAAIERLTETRDRGRHAKAVRPEQTAPHTTDVDHVRYLAWEYRDAVLDGDMARASEVRRTIDDLGLAAGSYVDGRWTLHEWVRREMGMQS